MQASQGAEARHAEGNAAEIDWTRVNDIPDSPDEPFYLQNPRKGMSGINVQVDALMNWGYRLPFRMNRSALKAHGIDMSIGAVSKIITNGGIALMPVMDGNRERLRKARRIHMDKTSFRVNGKNWHLWVFYDPDGGVVVYWMTQEKDSAVLETVLGDWEGAVICDGAPVFNMYKKKQRCWAPASSGRSTTSGATTRGTSACGTSTRG